MFNAIINPPTRHTTLLRRLINAMDVDSTSQQRRAEAENKKKCHQTNVTWKYPKIITLCIFRGKQDQVLMRCKMKRTYDKKSCETYDKKVAKTVIVRLVFTIQLRPTVSNFNPYNAQIFFVLSHGDQSVFFNLKSS